MMSLVKGMKLTIYKYKKLNFLPQSISKMKLKFKSQWIMKKKIQFLAKYSRINKYLLKIERRVIKVLGRFKRLNNLKFLKNNRIIKSPFLKMKNFFLLIKKIPINLKIPTALNILCILYNQIKFKKDQLRVIIIFFLIFINLDDD